MVRFHTLALREATKSCRAVWRKKIKMTYLVLAGYLWYYKNFYIQKLRQKL